MGDNPDALTLLLLFQMVIDDRSKQVCFARSCRHLYHNGRVSLANVKNTLPYTFLAIMKNV